MFRALDALKMKEDVLMFLAVGIHLGGTNLDFQMICYQRKSDGIYIINLKRTCKKLLLAACAIVAIWKLSCCQCHILQECQPAGYAEVCCCHRRHSYCWVPLLTRSKQRPGNRVFRWLLIPGLTTNLVQGYGMFT
ncbi:hypothetical protein P7K49_016757 [Saguinus oedipus]|uniref:40S ribosomal protein SA n=1 Tax=Saguinus oedipus TaxID=9490 RepID=A0ABQ9VF10_SAGOE|nr:hypothetical protein P7K49_016757 [Saguinus oedipus]